MASRPTVPGLVSPVHKPPTQPGRSTQCRLNHIYCASQKLHLTSQWPMAYPGLATHTLAGLCAQLLPCGTSSTGKLQHSAKPYPAQTTCPARPQHPVRDPPFLMHTAETAWDITVACGSPWLTTHTLTGLCALWLPSSASVPGTVQHSSAKPHPP